ncbi:hypothetical protein PanWU01x14_284840 [Parasponia andersonii]|uniref:Uncharacterized protein n=1 Tax=Parasponia andersonii TaxID=3476 RepID=A0A2P5AZY4_PARAD|nr:hypothetical protein PanWU01x14_284840 [Parasponia andersonii]
MADEACVYLYVTIISIIASLKLYQKKVDELLPLISPEMIVLRQTAEWVSGGQVVRTDYGDVKRRRFDRIHLRSECSGGVVSP